MNDKPLTTNPSTHQSHVRRIGIFIYAGADILDIAGPSEVFAFANLMLLVQGVCKEPAYVIDVLAERPEIVTTLSLIHI